MECINCLPFLCFNYYPTAAEFHSCRLQNYTYSIIYYYFECMGIIRHLWFQFLSNCWISQVSFTDSSASPDCELDRLNFLWMISVVTGHLSVCIRSKVISSPISTGLFGCGCRGYASPITHSSFCSSEPRCVGPFTQTQTQHVKAGSSLASLTRAVTVPHPCLFHLYSSPWCLEKAVGKSQTLFFHRPYLAYVPLREFFKICCLWQRSSLGILPDNISNISTEDSSEVVSLVMHSLLIKN